MNRTASSAKAIFFLGAGASIFAGAKGVVDLVDDFENSLKSKSESDFNVLEKIIVKLKEWITEQNLARQVDIELLLETVEKLENPQEDIILKFYNNKEFILNDFKADGSFSRELKLFIRKMCFISNRLS